MNALSLYVTTCRMIFQADINNAGSMKDINRLIMYLRQSLSCIVCNQLLKIPMSSSVAICQHHVCKSCIGGKMRLKPSCTWCKDYSKFIENIQLRILLQCYKRLTIYLKKSEISKKWATLQTGNTPGVLIGSSANSIYNLNQCPSNFKDLIDEGSNIQDNKYTFFEPPSLRNLNKSSSSQQQNNSTATNSTSIDNLDNSKLIHLTNTSNIKTILDKDDIINKSTQATIVRLTTRDNTISNQLISNSSLNHHLNNLQSNLTNSSLNHQSTTTTPSKSKNKVRKGCRCGLATLNPGKLTCCGQRCPCYVENKPCNGCKCRGCKNTNGCNNNNNSNNNTNSNLITNRSSPNYINTSSTINNQIITNNTSNLLSTSPNLFTTSSPSNLQLNNLNQATLISSTSTRNLLSPSFLLSPAATINTSTANLISNNSMFSTTGTNTSSGNKINISSSASSPSAAILLHNNVSTVGCESLTLPFPNIENIEDQVILSEENVCNIEEEQSLHHQIINEINYNE